MLVSKSQVHDNQRQSLTWALRLTQRFCWIKALTWAWKITLPIQLWSCLYVHAKPFLTALHQQRCKMLSTGRDCNSSWDAPGKLRLCHQLTGLKPYTKICMQSVTLSDWRNSKTVYCTFSNSKPVSPQESVQQHCVASKNNFSCRFTDVERPCAKNKPDFSNFQVPRRWQMHQYHPWAKDNNDLTQHKHHSTTSSCTLTIRDHIAPQRIEYAYWWRHKSASKLNANEMSHNSQEIRHKLWLSELTTVQGDVCNLNCLPPCRNVARIFARASSLLQDTWWTRHYAMTGRCHSCPIQDDVKHGGSALSALTASRKAPTHSTTAMSS